MTDLRVLDVACGIGVLTRALEKGCTATGLDINEGMLAAPLGNETLGSISAVVAPRSFPLRTDRSTR